MNIDWEKHESLEKEIQELRKTLPHFANQIPQEQWEKLQSLMDEQNECIVLIKDKIRGQR